MKLVFKALYNGGEGNPPEKANKKRSTPVVLLRSPNHVIF